MTTPKPTGRIPAPLSPADNEPLTVAPKRRLLARIYGPAWAIFRETPPFAGKMTPTREWERSTNGALLAIAAEAADRHGLHVDECAQAFTYGCEETVRYASELTDAALEAMTAILNSARPAPAFGDLRAHVLERAREATDAQMAGVVEQVDCEERLDRIAGYMDRLLSDSQHPKAYAAIFRLIRSIARDEVADATE